RPRDRPPAAGDDGHRHPEGRHCHPRRHHRLHRGRQDRHLPQSGPPGLRAEPLRGPVRRLRARRQSPPGHRGGDQRSPGRRLLWRRGGRPRLRQGHRRRPAPVAGAAGCGAGRAGGRPGFPHRHRFHPGGSPVMAARTPDLAPRLTDLLPGLRLPRDAVVTGLCLDSRRCAPGDAFVALPGGSHDGRRHIAEAVARGCGAVIAEDRDFDALVTGPVAVPLARVANLHRELSAIAGRFHGEPAARLRISAVTGTNGKTTCSYLLGQLLALLGEPTAIIGTLGHGRVGEGREGFEATGMTTPDALATQRILAGFVEQGVQVVAMEVSSHSLDQYRVAALPFDTAIFTNLSRDHLDYHGTLAAYGAAKARLFKWPGLRHAVINADDPFGRQLLADLPAGVDAIGYGLSTAAAVRVGDVTFGHGGVS